MVLDINYFAKQIEAMRGRVEALSEQVKETEVMNNQAVTDSFFELGQAIEELQVAEEELHAQINELEGTQLETERERKRYLDLFEFSPDGYLVSDLMGNIREANQAAAQLLHVPRNYLYGKPITVFIAETERKQFRAYLHQPREIQFEIQIKPRGHPAPTICAAMTQALLKDEEGQLIGLRWILRDITYEKKIAQELRESEERFRMISLDAPLGILLIDEEGRIIETNPAFEKMLGGGTTTLVGHPLIEFIPNSQANMVLGFLRQLKSGSRNVAELEIRLLRAGGEALWAKLSISKYLNRQNGPRFAIGIAEDVSDRHQMSADLREMQQRLLDGIEIERSILARDLHDGPIQDLYGSIFLLNHLNKASQNSSEMNDVMDILHQVISTLRSICGELKPPALAAFGLNRAILSYLDQAGILKTDVEVITELDDDAQIIPERIRLGLFRIFQSVMVNCLRHSEATQVLIRFHYNQDAIVLEVEDNGRGFQVPTNWLEMVRQGHFGLASSLERAGSLGGAMAVESTLGSGTKVKVTLPGPAVYQVESIAHASSLPAADQG